MVENQTARDIEVYGVIGTSPILFGVAAPALPNRIRIPSGLHNNRIGMLFHVVGTDDWFRAVEVKVEPNTDYTVTIRTDPTNGQVLVAGRPST